MQQIKRHILQTAAHCNTLQHTATHCSTLHPHRISLTTLQQIKSNTQRIGSEHKLEHRHHINAHLRDIQHCSNSPTKKVTKKIILQDTTANWHEEQQN